MPRYLGIDSSLTGTGLCRALIDGYDADGYVADVELATCGASNPRKGDTWIAKSRRVHEVLDGIEAAMTEQPVDAIGLEELAYGAKGSGLVVLHWIWGEVINLSRVHSIPLYLVNPSGVKKFATGNGNAKKDVVMLAMAKRYPQFAIGDNNQSDALAVCMMLARHLDHPFDTMPQLNLEAMNKVAAQ